MSQALRKISGNVSKSKCIVIFINQTRMKIGVVYGNPETTTGGVALKFYSSVRLEIKRERDKRRKYGPWKRDNDKSRKEQSCASIPRSEGRHNLWTGY